MFGNLLENIFLKLFRQLKYYRKKNAAFLLPEKESLLLERAAKSQKLLSPDGCRIVQKNKLSDPYARVGFYVSVKILTSIFLFFVISE